MWRLINAFASHSTLSIFSGDVLHNSDEVGAHLGGHPVILCSVEALCSLLAGNEDKPLSSQPSASVERVTLHWVSLCHLDRSCKPVHVRHMVFVYSALTCSHKHQVLCSRSYASLMSLDKHDCASRPTPFCLLCHQYIRALFQRLTSVSCCPR